MSPKDSCPDCGGALERMELQGEDAMGHPVIVSEAGDDGFLSSVRAGEVLTPVPYVCADCQRIFWYADA